MAAMKRVVICVWAVVVVSAAVMAGEHGPGVHFMQTEHFRLSYPSGYRGKASLVARVAESALVVLTGSLDVELEDDVEIHLFETRTAMFAWLGREPQAYVMGLAVPGRNAILLGIVKDEPLARTTAHELAHIVLFEKFGSMHPAEQPRWLHEGLAQLAAGELTADQRSLLGQASVGNELMGIAEMELGFGGDHKQTGLAYAQSFTLVEYLQELRPQGGIAALVANLEDTGDLNRAMIRTYKKTQAQIEAQWLSRIRAEYLKAGLPLSADLMVWAGMGVLFIIAIIVQCRRRAAIRKRLAEEEELRELFR